MRFSCDKITDTGIKEFGSFVPKLEFVSQIGLSLDKYTLILSKDNLLKVALTLQMMGSWS